MGLIFKILLDDIEQLQKTVGLIRDCDAWHQTLGKADRTSIFEFLLGLSQLPIYPVK